MQVFDARDFPDLIDDGLVDGRERLAGLLVDGSRTDKRDVSGLVRAVEDGDLAAFGEVFPLDGLVEEGEEVVLVGDGVSFKGHDGVCSEDR